MHISFWTFSSFLMAISISASEAFSQTSGPPPLVSPPPNPPYSLNPVPSSLPVVTSEQEVIRKQFANHLPQRPQLPELILKFTGSCAAATLIYHCFSLLSKVKTFHSVHSRSCTKLVCPMLMDTSQTLGSKPGGASSFCLDPFLPPEKNGNQNKAKLDMRAA